MLLQGRDYCLIYADLSLPESHRMYSRCLAGEEGEGEGVGQGEEGEGRGWDRG